MDVPEGFDVDESELIQLYKRIPPPDLRAYALNVARERVVTDVVRKVKEDGVFDSFRKTWLKDLEAKVYCFSDSTKLSLHPFFCAFSPSFRISSAVWKFDVANT